MHTNVMGGFLMPIPNEVRQHFDAFFDAHAHEYNMAHADECGRYMEAAIPYVRAKGFPKVGFLLYNGSGTKYNGHRIDSFLYDEVTENDKLQSCDVIANAETNHASKGWSPDEPRYSKSDWSATVPNSQPTPNMVPWILYDETSFQELKRTLAFDYARRPQGPDYDVSVWAARTFHNAYMGPDKTPLGISAGVARARNEWCVILGVPVIPIPPGWNIGDPV